MNHSAYFSVIFLLLAAISPPAMALKYALGSCVDQRMAQPIWQAIENEKIDGFIFLGDNVYGDSKSGKLDRMKQAYAQQKKSFPSWLNKKQVLAIWDDHDYGINDGGGDYPKKIEAESLFFDFWQVPSDDPRRSREGVYFDYKKNADGVIIHFIGLDTRYFRSPLPDKNTKLNLIDRANDTVLGESQWEWLTQTLDSSNADLIVILSSIQVLATDHPYEKWSNFPLERARLISMLSSAAQNKTVITLSGDRHRSGFYQLDNLIELTASPLNKVSSQNPEFDPLLLNKTYPEINYGILDLQVEKLRVALSLHDGVGDLLEQHYVPLKSHN